MNELQKDFENVKEKLKNKMSCLKIMEVPDKETINSIEKYMMNIKIYSEDLYKHSIGVSILSGTLGKLIGMDKTNQRELFIAGALHDIGKIYLPIKIINKPDRLDEVEMNIIKAHPALSVYILNREYVEDTPNILNYNILKAIEQHHENVDGSGYYGLKGEQISIAGRCISIMDKIEAYGAKRSYHSDRSLEDTIAYIRKEGERNKVDNNILNEIF